MIKTIIFRCKLDGLSLADVHELKELLERVGAAIQTVHADALIDPRVDAAEAQDKKVGAASNGAGDSDAYLEVRKRGGGREYYYAPGDGTHRAITKDEYDAAHASPEMQAQLENARRVAGTQLNGEGA